MHVDREQEEEGGKKMGSIQGLGEEIEKALLLTVASRLVFEW